SELLDQLVAALWTVLIQLHILGLLCFAQLLGGLAIGISGASHELAEATLLQHHGTAAVLAVYRCILLGEIGLIDIRQIDRKLARVGAIRIAGTGDETAVAAPFDHHGLAALFADQISGTLHALNVGHVALGVREVLLE